LNISTLDLQKNDIFKQFYFVTTLKTTHSYNFSFLENAKREYIYEREVSRKHT